MANSNAARTVTIDDSNDTASGTLPYEIPKYDRTILARPSNVSMLFMSPSNFACALVLDRICRYNEVLAGSGGSNEMIGIRGLGIRRSDHGAALSNALRENNFQRLLVSRSTERDTARMIGSMIDHLYVPDAPEKLIPAIASPHTKFIGLTVSESAYYVNKATGALDTANADITHDIALAKNGAISAAALPKTPYGALALGLRQRMKSGGGPLALLSCDNVQQNGVVLSRALQQFCTEVDPSLARWVADMVRCPSAMVDRITPGTKPEVAAELRAKFGVPDHTPIVVCEDFSQWVLEKPEIDGFPDLTRVGVEIVEDVRPYEQMKLQLLNAAHSSLVYGGVTAGYVKVCDIFRDPLFCGLIRGVWSEAIPILKAIPGLDYHAYVKKLESRFTNEPIGDEALRICALGSTKIPDRILPSLRSELAANGPIAHLTLAVALWARFLLGTDEKGAPMLLNDAMKDTLPAIAQKAKTDPSAFIDGLPSVFGPELIGSTRFRDTFATLLRRVYDQGVRGAIESVVNEK